ncbi:MAG: hypothetical protein PHD76_11010 [Methylacidiphilales bacterium]|nr:hypothetical protein [Candidatus Methylacidiphilales bacterium]
MKTASVADLRNNFAAVSRWIEEGEPVEIKKRGRFFATLSPARKKKAKIDWPDFEGRLAKVFPRGPVKGASTREIVDYMRGDY